MEFKRRYFDKISGKIKASDHRQTVTRLCQSYVMVGAFPHHYEGYSCSMTNSKKLSDIRDRILNSSSVSEAACKEKPAVPYSEKQDTVDSRQGICALDFDHQGKYLVSVTSAGCMSVYDFNEIFEQKSSNCKGEQLINPIGNHLLDLKTPFNTVKWNVFDNNQVVCTAKEKMLIYNVSEAAVEREFVCSRKISTVEDICFGRNNGWIVLASCKQPTEDGVVKTGVAAWDLRSNRADPMLKLNSSSCFEDIHSIQVDVNNNIVYGAGMNANFYMWDIRGCKTTQTTLLEQKKESLINMAADLISWTENEAAIKWGSTDWMKLDQNPGSYYPGFHSINLNPEYPNQLGFHHDLGWSGVLDTSSFSISHLCCPGRIPSSPAYMCYTHDHRRRAAWLSRSSIYLVADPKGMHFLDFHPKSRTSSLKWSEQINVATSLSLSQGVISCVTHPLWDVIVAGTQESCLLLISQYEK